MASSPFRRLSENDDQNRAVAAAYNTPRALTAAASRTLLNSDQEAERFRKRQTSQVRQWQSAAWEYYDAIGEIKFAFNLVSSIVSRIRLFSAVVVDPSESPVEIRKAGNIDPNLADAAGRALARLDSAYGGQAGLLRDAALNLSVAGECHLVQVPARHIEGKLVPESWDIRSVDELRVDSKNKYYITPTRASASSSGDASKDIIYLPETAFSGRIWRAHPRYSGDPDSSLRGLLDLCDELLLLNRTYRATHRSRLNAGMLFLPDGLSNQGSPDPGLFDDEFEEDEESTPEEIADQFEIELLTAMSTPIEDESSASAVVPLLVRGAAEMADKIKLIKFERAFDDSMNARYERVLERILQGLDVPKDTVTGLANVKYSNAIQIDEALYKAHIEPMLVLIADSITTIFLRPYLHANTNYSEEEINRIVIWYDPSSVATRNDRASDADSGYEKMTISAETWRKAHGFNDADAPTATELALRLLQKSPSMTPELTEALLSVVAPEVMAAARAAQQANSVAPIPAEAAQMLQGGVPGADPAATGAPVEGPEGEVAPGEDAPPFALAEPTAEAAAPEEEEPIV